MSLSKTEIFWQTTGSICNN